MSYTLTYTLCFTYTPGIQAVQTLSRLNRAHPGKSTTYVVDFVNEAQEVLEAFRTYYETAELEATTDPNLVLNLRVKLDVSGYCSDREVVEVARVALDPKATQAQLLKALTPPVDRLRGAYDAAKEAHEAARARGDVAAEQAARDALEALMQVKGDMGAYLRLYTFLSQIFDYANTDLERRSIFFKYLLPQLEFTRDRETIDLSKVTLTHHALKRRDAGDMRQGGGEAAKLAPMTGAGTGQVQEPQRVYLAELIEKVNSLFDGELTDGDKLRYVNTVILGKMLESETLAQQAANNSKEQFATSPDLKGELLNAIMASLDAHTLMSSQALNSDAVREGMLTILLDHAHLWEHLRRSAEDRAR